MTPVTKNNNETGDVVSEMDLKAHPKRPAFPTAMPVAARIRPCGTAASPHQGKGFQ
jgi:hypothetical protein